jgi:protein SCO1/2
MNASRLQVVAAMGAASIVSLALLLLPAGPCMAAVDEMSGEPSHESQQPAAEGVHEHHEHEGMEAATQPAHEIGVDERLGEKVPLDLALLDEQGREIRLGEAIIKPTLLMPVYYSCPTVCSLMLANLAQAINKTPLELGKDYRVIAFSFDEQEGPDIARHAKHNYTKILKEGLPADEWSFLTADAEGVRALTHGIGFRFKKIQENLFIHPNVLLALAPDGTIIRYLYGPTFLPFDIGMALTEAAKGTPGLSVRKLLTYCFDYDTESKSYIFKSFRLLAVGILILLLAFFLLVLRRGKRTA